MGGVMSSRWGWHRKRRTVEDCRTLELSEVAREATAKGWTSGRLRWLQGETEVASLGYTIAEAYGMRVLTLEYTITDTGERVTIPVELETTRPRFGGVRWWGRCPCGRRVGKLYLPPGATRFACRYCHGLTYASCQQHDKRADALRRNPQALAALVNNPGECSPADLCLALKALRFGRDGRAR
jgi:hypothetical protein